MLKVAGWLSALVVVGWIVLITDVQRNFTDDPQPAIAYRAVTFYAVVALLLIWLAVLFSRR